MAQRVFGSSVVFARWWQLISFLRVLKVTSPHFKDVIIPDEMEMRQMCEKSTENLKQQADKLTDPALMELERKIGSDIAGARHDDVPDDGGEENTDMHETEEEESICEEDVAFNASFVVNDPVVEGSKDETDMIKRCLKSIGGLVTMDEDEVVHAPEDKSKGDGNSEHSGSDGNGGDIKSDDESDGEDQERMAEPSPQDNPDYQSEDAYLEALSSRWKADTVSMRQKHPIQEFDCPEMLPMAFPTTFMLGRGYPKKSANLGARELHHLLHQFSNIPARDYRLQGYLADVKGRFAVMHNVNASVKSSPKAQAVMAELLESKEKQEELVEAIKNPGEDGKIAKRVLGHYLPHIQFSGRNVMGSMHEAFRLKSELSESCRRYGEASSFDTVSPNDVDNPRSFRASFWTPSNVKFPAMFERNCPFGSSPERFLGNLQKSFTEVIQMEIDGRGLDRSSRADAALRNPVAYVDECKRLIADVCSILFGMPLEHFFSREGSDSMRKTWSYTCFKGILGHCQALIGVMEDHARGTLHFHTLFIGGLSPFALQKYATTPDLCAAMAKVIDAQQTAEFPAKALLAKIVKNQVRFKIPRGSNDPPSEVPHILKNSDMMKIVTEARREGCSIREKIEMDVKRTCDRQFHFHVLTCRERTAGKTGCRLMVPQGMREKTHPVSLKFNPKAGELNEDGTKELKYTVEELELNNTEPKHELSDVLHQREGDSVLVWEPKRDRVDPILGSVEDSPSRDEILQRFRSCLGDTGDFSGWKDFWNWLEKLAFVDLLEFYSLMVEKLEKANGYVTAFNVTLSRLTSFHNNVLLLGSMDQSVGAVFYICPYMGKKKLPMLESLTILYNSLRHVQKYPSCAPDSGSQSRSVIHLLEHTLNQMHLKMELSQYQIVAQLLQLPTVLTTEKYAFMKPQSELAMSAVLRHPANLISKLIMSQKDFPSSNLVSDELELSDESEETSEDGSSEEDSDSVTTSSEEGESDAIDGVLMEVEDTFDSNDLQNLLSGVGSHKCYTVEEESSEWVGESLKKFVPHSLLYNNRGRALRHLNRYEMCALTKLEVKPKDDSRGKLERFEMAPAFVLSARHAYVLQQKQCTPLLTSKMPRHPGLKPRGASSQASWRKKADQFAAWLLIVYRPELEYYDTHQQSSNPYQYTFDALEKWIEDLQNDDNVISKFRLMMVQRCIRNMRARKKLTQMLTEYRGRSRDLWDVQRSRQFKRGDNDIVGISESTWGTNDMQASDLSAAEMKNRMQRVHNLTLAENALTPENGTRRHKTGHASNPLPGCISALSATLATLDRAVSEINNIAAEIKSMQKDDPLSNNIWEAGSKDNDRKKPALKYANFSPNQQQKYLSDMILRSVLGKNLETGNSANHMLPPITLVTGSAGTGKSTLLLWVKEQIEQEGKKVFTTTFNNINALHVGGRTTSSAVNIWKLSSKDKLCTLPEADLLKFMKVTSITRDSECVSLIIMDEVSNYAPFHIAWFDVACRQATCVNRPFGGIPMIFTGDLYQLFPVKAGMSLTQAVLQLAMHQHRHIIEDCNGVPRVKYESRKKIRILERDDKKLQPGHPFREGAQLFQSAKWYNLEVQQRVDKDTDPIHSAFVTKLGRGGMVTKEDMEHIKELSEDDLKTEKWLRAPMITTLNHERILYTHCRSLALAQFLDKPVVRWLANLKIRRSSSLEHFDAVHDPSFYEYFLESVEGFLTGNVCRCLGLVNGLKCTYHSIVPSCEEDRETIARACEEGNFLLVTLQQAPHCVNVEINPDDLGHLPQEGIDRLLQLSLDNPQWWDDDVDGAKTERKKIIIPIVPEHSGRDPFKVYSMKEPFNTNLDAEYVAHFPLEMSLAMTVNKSEGQTLRKGVILALSKHQKCNFQHNGLYVAMSRTPENEDIRKFILGRTAHEKEQSIQYIYGLKPDISIPAFFRGFGVGFGRDFDESVWLDKTFSALDAALYMCSQNMF